MTWPKVGILQIEKTSWLWESSGRKPPGSDYYFKEKIIGEERNHYLPTKLPAMVVYKWNILDMKYKNGREHKWDNLLVKKNMS